jgi:HK97 family phage prohead protease
MTTIETNRSARPNDGERTERAFGFETLAIRAAGDDDAPDTLTLEGYASVTESPYEMYGGPPYGWTEIIARSAFRKTLSEGADVQLLINHEGMPLARTKSGTLELRSNNTGLRVKAGLEPASATVQELRIAMERGDIDEMSFAFRIIRSQWLDEAGNEVDDPWDGVTRRILEVSLDKGDVSVVNYGANPATSAVLRSLRSVEVHALDKAIVAIREGTATEEVRAIVRAAADELAELLETRLTAPASPADPAEVHRRRLATQRARYL